MLGPAVELAIVALRYAGCSSFERIKGACSEPVGERVEADWMVVPETPDPVYPVGRDALGSGSEKEMVPPEALLADATASVVLGSATEFVIA